MNEAGSLCFWGLLVTNLADLYLPAKFSLLQEQVIFRIKHHLTIIMVVPQDMAYRAIDTVLLNHNSMEYHICSSSQSQWVEVTL
jgi:hypothetical protein